MRALRDTFVPLRASDTASHRLGQALSANRFGDAAAARLLCRNRRLVATCRASYTPRLTPNRGSPTSRVLSLLIFLTSPLPPAVASWPTPDLSLARLALT